MNNDLKNYYENYVIESLNLTEWCKARTFCDDLRYRYEQRFHRLISKSITNLLIPFESLRDIKTPKRLDSNERHKILQKCIESNIPSKTYLQIIKDTRTFIKDELDKIPNNIYTDMLLAEYLKTLEEFLMRFEWLYMGITRDLKRPRHNRDKEPLCYLEFSSITFIRSANDGYSIRAEIQFWNSVKAA